MKRETVENITASVLLVGIAIIILISGAVENGCALGYMLWCLPILAVMLAIVMWCNYDEYKRRIRRYKFRKRNIR